MENSIASKLDADPHYTLFKKRLQKLNLLTPSPKDENVVYDWQDFYQSILDTTITIIFPEIEKPSLSMETIWDKKENRQIFENHIRAILDTPLEEEQNIEERIEKAFEFWNEHSKGKSTPNKKYQR